MKYHTLFFRELKKMSQNLSSAAVEIDTLRVKVANSADADEISHYVAFHLDLHYCQSTCLGVYNP